MKEQLANLIREKRPSVTASTIKTYVSLLNSLNKKVNGGKDNFLEFIETNAKEIVEYIDENMESLQSRKTLLSALYVVCGVELYKDAMIRHAHSVNEFYKSKKVLPQREGLDVSLEYLRGKYDEYLARLKKNSSVENYVNYFVTAFTSTKILKPRRNEWIYLKLKNVNKDEDNYIDSKGFFIFNKFKTAKFHEKGSDEKRVQCPPELLKIIKKFSKISDNDYLLYHERNGEQWTSSYFTKKLQSIYGDGITTDVIRSLYISELYKDVPELLEKLNKTASAMGTSVNASMLYYDKNEK